MVGDGIVNDREEVVWVRRNDAWEESKRGISWCFGVVVGYK